MRAAHTALTDEDEDEDTEITSDDMSSAMVPFIQQIAEFSKLSPPETIHLAFDLVLDLGDESYGDMDVKHGCGFGDRPSDGPADRLLCNLATQKRNLDPTWRYRKVLIALSGTSDGLAEYGIETYFINAIRMMKLWSRDNSP